MYVASPLLEDFLKKASELPLYGSDDPESVQDVAAVADHSDRNIIILVHRVTYAYDAITVTKALLYIGQQLGDACSVRQRWDPVSP